MPDIMHMLKIDAAPERVYRAITTADGVRHWWTHDTELDTEVGGAGQFGFFDRRVVTTVRVEALVPPTHVGWRVASSGAPGGWVGTTIAFDLRPDGDATTLLFAHRGFAEADEGYARVTTGWGIYLQSLRQYLETGTGTPH